MAVKSFAAGLAFAGVPSWRRAEADVPAIVGGVQSGDVQGDRAIVWSRCDRSSRMIVEWDTTDQFDNIRRHNGPSALEFTDFTARTDLTGLPPDQTIFYRVRFQDLSDLRVYSQPVEGHFRTASRRKKNIRFAFSGDTAGQGWGIDIGRGGMGCYETIRRQEPDLFIHSGDNIYADNPIQPEVRLPDGTVWKNITTPEKSKVAETLDEFRGAYRYNLLDENLRRFNAAVPLLTQWDDHEVRNNWYPGQRLDSDPRYKVKSCDLLAARAKRAFLDYVPIRFDPLDPERVCRAFHYGPSLDVFMLDERSYRGRNSPNRQAAYGPEAHFLGPDQLTWIKTQLRASRATWKVIASDMPIGLMVGDSPPGNFEAWANGDGPPLGRELEMAELLRFIRDHRIRNIVWVTADVHYAAAHYYNPSSAQFTDFRPFWEFVAGPLHAGTFGPGALDNTFGPEVKYNSVKPGAKWTHGPDGENQFFGTGRIDGRTEALTVALWNRAGQKLYSVDLSPERG